MKRIKYTRPDLVVIVRHAQSMRNAAKRGRTHFADEDARAPVAGIPDHLIELTSLGLAQAREVGIHIRKRFGVFDYAYTSGYVRTDQTLAGILEAYSAEERARTKVRFSPFIRERDPGYTYDMTEAEAEKNFPWLKGYWKTFGGFFAVPPGGESLAQVMGRVHIFRHDLDRVRAGKKILITIHGGTIRCLRADIEHWDYQRATAWPKGQSPKNCGVTVYRFDPKVDRLVLQEYNTVYPVTI